jgi:Phage T4 tail fibre
MNSLTNQYPSLMKTRVFTSSLLSLMFVALTNLVQAQWTTASTNIHNSNTGNVGINNTNPLVKLAVDISSTTTTYNGYTGANVALMLKNKSNTANNFTVLSFANSGTNTIADITAINTNHSTHTGRLCFSTRAAGAGPQQRMLIDENGNVGIGTTTPASKLQINGNGTGTTALSIIENSASTVGAHFISEGANNIMFQLKATANGGINTELRTGGNSYLNALYGNVGIGTTAPLNKLQIGSNPQGWNENDMVISNSTNSLAIHNTPTHTYLYGSGDIAIRPGFGQMAVYAKANGDVGIGTTAPDAKLAVKGTIHAQEVRVDLNGAVAPDYVFEKDYNLMPLDELKLYLEANKHLPEVPSAKEMDAQGVNLKEMNLLLLKKVEELTLYQIQSIDRIQKLEKEIETLKKKTNE